MKKSDDWSGDERYLDEERGKQKYGRRRTGKAGNEEESRVTNQSVICKQRQQSSGEMARDTSQLTTLSVTNYERVESEDSKKIRENVWKKKKNALVCYTMFHDFFLNLDDDD